MRKISLAPDTPEIFADVVVDDGQRVDVLNVERNDIENTRAWMNVAERVGLQRRGKRKPDVWVRADGRTMDYFSQVNGRISQDGHEYAERVACIKAGDVYVWLHKDGTVEVGDAPTIR